MTILGRGVDEFEADLLKSSTRCASIKSLSESENSLANTNAGTLDHKEVFVDKTIMRESTHGVDRLLGKIIVGRAVGLVIALANTVDLLVGLRAVMVTVLTGTGTSP